MDAESMLADVVRVTLEAHGVPSTSADNDLLRQTIDAAVAARSNDMVAALVGTLDAAVDALGVEVGAQLSAVLQCCVDVAGRRYEPRLPDVPFEVDEDEGAAVKIVRLVRKNEPLGATIKCEPDGAVVIARVIAGGLAHTSGCIQVGDRVLEVNGVSVHGRAPADIVGLLQHTESTVTFKLVPGDGEAYADAEPLSPDVPPTGQDTQYVRCLFDYDPVKDPLHPCPEAGQEFRRGDVLALVDATDEHWWQARPVSLPSQGHLNGHGERVGLVPSRALMDTRQASVQRPASAPARTYESVVLYRPSAKHIRPIVLIGPPGVGRNELQRRLVLLDGERFGTTTPHTSRPQKQNETDGVDYNFVSRTQMETWIKQGAFIEYGEYRNNLYGTLLSSVERVMATGRTPVLTPHPQALAALVTSRLHPIVVFVQPPSFAALKETRCGRRAQSTQYTREFTDAELRAMVNNAHSLQSMYGHWFDYELVNASLEYAFRELCDAVHRLHGQSKWIPQSD